MLDASTLIAYLDRRESVTPVAIHIIDEYIRTGRNLGVVSMISVMEVLVRPLRQGAPEPYRHVLDFLTSFPNLRAAEVDLPVVQEAASLRAVYNFSPPDALTIATGLVAQVGHLFTNDGTWSPRLHRFASRVSICQLSDHLPFP